MKKNVDQLFDVRVVEKNIETGKITRAEYEEHLAGLDDCADRADTLTASLVFTRGRIDVGREMDDDEAG